jgi:precorrin-6A/cobalt-precorrin-6A reductase
MILLIGGTSETAPLAGGLAEAGYTVLVSTATDLPLEIGRDPRISRRTGPLDEEGMVALVQERGIRVIVDAAHPYAAVVHTTVQAAALRLGIPCLLFRREESPSEVSFTDNGRLPILWADHHDEGARMAFAVGCPVLLTIGSRNLAPYAEEAIRTDIPLAVRILNAPESVAACRRAGISDNKIIAGRGPFSIQENLEVIDRFAIGVLVTKESGIAGGLDAKLSAARERNCTVIVIRRPALRTLYPIFSHPTPLISALHSLLPPHDATGILEQTCLD